MSRLPRVDEPPTFDSGQRRVKGRRKNASVGLGEARLPSRWGMLVESDREGSDTCCWCPGSCNEPA